MKMKQELSYYESRRVRVLRRLFNLFRFSAVLLIAAVFSASQQGGSAQDAAATQPTTAPALPPGSSSIPPDLYAAFLRFGQLKDADSEGRQQIYSLLADKGDARLIPALEAYRDGKLQNRDGQLVIIGESRLVNDVKKFPVLDAFTLEVVPGTPEWPAYLDKIPSPSEKGMTRLPPRARSERNIIADVITTLSLLHPDPATRINSIRDAGERASRVFPNAEDEERIRTAMDVVVARLSAAPTTAPTTAPSEAAGPTPIQALLAAIKTAQEDKPRGLFDATPSVAVIEKVKSAAAAAATALGVDKSAGATSPKAGSIPEAVVKLEAEADMYIATIGKLSKNLEDLPKYAAALKKQLSQDAKGPFTPALTEAVAQTDAVLGTGPERLAAIGTLGEIGTMRAENMLRKMHIAATRIEDKSLVDAISPNLDKAASYQRTVRTVQYTFAGLSTGSIYVLLALGLAVIFGLMGVINMAHGEFMMVGAFTTYVVASWFKTSFPGAYNFFPIVAVPAAFLVAGIVGLLTETLIIRHLYGRTIDTLIATIGISLILMQVARVMFGDSLSYAAPTWMQGSIEVAPDLQLNQARLWTIVYCIMAITVVYVVVNKTSLGLLLRATTQNRQMAAALGVPTRRVDALTFAFGSGLAGLAGVVVPMIDKINPSMGQDYVVSSFMVVVVGGVGKLAGAIIAGFGIGSIGNFLEPLLGSIKMFASTSSVLSKVLVLALVVMFLQWRPSGLFPPKGRLADA